VLFKMNVQSTDNEKTIVLMPTRMSQA